MKTQRQKNKISNRNKHNKNFDFGYDYVDTGTGKVIEEPFMGAWQRNIALVPKNADRNFAYFSCVTISSNSIGNLPPLLQVKKNGIWSDAEDKKFDWVKKLLENPNPNQYTNDFLTRVTMCIQQKGNAYLYKQRGRGGIIEKLWVMNPENTQVLVSEEGEVFYQFGSSKIVNIDQTIRVPSSEVIHIRINCLFNDLCGIAPLHAAFIHAMNSIEMQETSHLFYKNLAQPSGILTAPEAITKEAAQRIKSDFESNKRKSHGSVVVVGDGLQYTPISMSAHDQQLIQLMKFNAEAICSCFHIPPYKILGNAPTYNNVEALNLEYYNNALQFIVNAIEHSLTYGLELRDLFDEELWIELDTNELLQMDKKTRGDFYNNAIKGGWMTPNEARAQEDMKGLPGGDTVYMQQQNYSLEALASRDATDPLVVPPPDPTPVVEEVVEEEEKDSSDVDSSSDSDDNNEKSFVDFLSAIKKGFE